MAIELSHVVVKHERRIQLYFTATLHASAFTNLASYLVEAQLGAASPTVVAAIAVTGAANAAELVLSLDLVQGVSYLVSAVGVEAADTSLTTGASSMLIRTAADQEQGGRPRDRDDRDALLYGVDLAFADGDFVEDHDGDLAAVSGITNYHGAITRRMGGSPLPYDPDYSVRARESVDAPSPTIDDIRNEAIRQARKDRRTTAADAVVVASEDGAFEIRVDVVPVGQKNALTATAKIAR